MNKFRVVNITISPFESLDKYLNSLSFENQLNGIYGHFKLVSSMFIDKDQQGYTYQFVLERLE